jgi:hypothetical protein
MKPNRRTMLGLLGSGALTGRRMAQQAAAQISGISVGNNDKYVGQELRTILKDQVDLNRPRQSIDWKAAQDEAIKWALGNPVHRAELESLLYEQYRNIHTLDPDIAYNNCYSMAAKIAYQRQRNVQRDLDNTLKDTNIWNRVNKWKEDIFKAQGIFERFAGWLSGEATPQTEQPTTQRIA